MISNDSISNAKGSLGMYAPEITSSWWATFCLGQIFNATIMVIPQEMWKDPLMSKPTMQMNNNLCTRMLLHLHGSLPCINKKNEKEH